MSQLLSRLRDQYSSAVDPLQRAELGARIAANLARVGNFDDARAWISELRTVYGDGRSGRITVWIMLAEGLVYLYEDLNPLALDRINRAQVLAVAMQYSTVAALASAWKAHIEFELSDFSAMAASLRLAREHVAAGDHDAHTRIAMVISNCFMLCGEERESYKWFILGREHALKNGDQASLEALLYNRATMGLGWLRVNVCNSSNNQEDLQRIRSEVRSARNLQALTGISTMENHVSLMEARLLTIDARYGEAIEKLQDVRNKSPFAEHNFSQALIDLEVSYCYAQAGRIEDALEAFRTVNHEAFSTLDMDEQIVALWMRQRLCELDGRFGLADELRQPLFDLQAQHAKTCAALRLSLEQFQER